ncbi:hypothetical protein MTR62_07715 [Novosphingobium sp. 1949]|uniref:Uncharacterized protein n=1 Tax=Novosphingobium organovorum TaxID=2930092 RepID=A0ABT0BBZ8_9SPHN|nr:hypothetical protein [Novosphingobium organovorum]MCJ2182577.1 hypothetical protein [Novosphingobium organovorum]
MADNSEIEIDIERAILNINGHFWNLLVEMLAKSGNLNVHEFVDRVSEFVRKDTEISSIERSILDMWRKDLAMTAERITGRPSYPSNDR